MAAIIDKDMFAGPAPSPARTPAPDTQDDSDELRIALVMNGGVSLAVWIGGVTAEYARLMAAGRRRAGRGRPSHSTDITDIDAIYDQILALVKLTPRIDVIAGTSAGGVNAAFLGASIAFTKTATELDTAMAGLRNIWIEDGAIDKLLRDPAESAPPSLLDGNGYYYQALLDAFERIPCSPPVPANAINDADNGLDLTLTTTLITGEPQHITDDYGTSVPDISYRACFRFRRGSKPGARDDFKGAHIIPQLALAARATSSFPGAFEPVFCPIKDTPPAADDVGPDGRAYMNGIALTAAGVPLTSSRYVVDGGVLDNKPLDVAIDAITAQPATRRARRVLAYVVPDPGAPDSPPPPADPDAAPSVLEVVAGSASAIPMAQSISNQINALRLHNAAVRGRRLDRAAVATNLDRQELFLLSDTLFNAYRERRFTRLQDEAVEAINAQLSACEAAQPMIADGRRQRVFTALDSLRLSNNLSIPHASPQPDGAEAERGTTWRWGHRAVVHIGWLAYDLLVRFERTSHPSAAITAPLWKRLSQDQARADELVRDTKTRWSDKRLARVMGGTAASVDTGDLKELAMAAVGIAAPRTVSVADVLGTDAPLTETDDAIGAGASASELGSLATKFADVVADLAAIARSESGTDAPGEKEFTNLLDMVVPKTADGDTPVASVLAGMLAWHVVEDTLGGGDVLAEEKIAFIQVSANDDEVVAAARRTRQRMAPAKLCSDQLAAFAGFYKQSWRAKDWTWGRRDAVGRILRVLLDPVRLREVGATASGVRAVIQHIGQSTGADQTALAAICAHIENTELAYLGEQALPPPEQLPNTIRVLADAIETLILVEELPVIARCVRSDASIRSNIPLEVSQMADEVATAKGQKADLIAVARALLPPAGDPGPEKGLLSERWSEELGTDPALYTGARALAVAMGVIASCNGTMKKLSPGLSPLRWFAWLFYVFAKGNANQSHAIINLCFGVLVVSFTIILSQIAAGAKYYGLVTIAAYVGFAASYFALVLMPRLTLTLTLKRLLLIGLPLVICVVGLYELCRHLPHTHISMVELNIALVEIAVAIILLKWPFALAGRMLKSHLRHKPKEPPRQ